MNKILVKIYVPMIEEQYDILIPINRKIHSVITLISKAIYEFSDGCFDPDNIPTLFDKITANPFDYNKTVKECEIKNGSELILI